MTDLISRQDAIRIVDGIDTWQAGWRGNAIESLKALPSAQERKKGRWINSQSFEFIGDPLAFRQCSECGSTAMGVFPYKFCGNCGAEMSEGDDNEQS